MNTILGLDLGKFKRVACVYDPNTQEARHETIATGPAHGRPRSGPAGVRLEPIAVYAK